jgi:hypothetical protein
MPGPRLFARWEACEYTLACFKTGKAMTGKTLSILILIVAGGPGVLSGCNSNPVGKVPFEVPVVAWNDDGEYLAKRVGPGLVAAVDSPIPDVPMPIGFKPVVSQCSSSFDGVARTVTHVYQGRARAVEAVLFYRQQLPAAGWVPVERTVHEDNSTGLHYVKGAESLALRLSERFNVATIEIYMTAR